MRRSAHAHDFSDKAAWADDRHDAIHETALGERLKIPEPLSFRDIQALIRALEMIFAPPRKANEKFDA
jgi:hypothetical protein